MFSGLIMHRATVENIRMHAGGGMQLTIVAPEAIAEGVAHGDSIAVNGVCLTVISFTDQTLSFEIVPESLRRSNLGKLSAGDKVNLELSLRLGDRLGGHLVYAHVDATVALIEKIPEGQGFLVGFACPERYERYIVEKGYVCLDGVSLTVADVAKGKFRIAMIPETAAVTTLGRRQIGDEVNLEIDPLARYAIDGALRYAPPSTT